MKAFKQDEFAYSEAAFSSLQAFNRLDKSTTWGRAVCFAQSIDINVNVNQK